MAWFRVRNRTDLPVHVAISQAGIIYFHGNNLPPGGYWEADVGIGGYDLTVVPSNGSNSIDPARDNVAGIAKWVVGAGAVALGVAGVVLIPFTGGASVAFTVAAGVAGASLVTVVADVAVSIADAKLNPRTVEGLYGPDGYNFEIVGGNIIGHKDGDKFVITEVKQFQVHYHNNTTGNGDFSGSI